MAEALLPSQIFANITSAKMRLDANYEKEGHYLERIDKIKLDKNRKGEAFLAVEKTVVKIIAPPPAGKEGHKVGEAICHMLMVRHDSFLGNVKSMIAAIMELKPEDIKPEDAVAICAADQPLTGMVVECQNRGIMTKENKPFTAINYKREVPPIELLSGVLDAEAIRLYFPNEILNKLMAAQQAQNAA